MLKPSDKAFERERKTWLDLRRRLAWLYGEDRMLEIMAGTDEAANSDRQAWLALGRRPDECDTT